MRLSLRKQGQKLLLTVVIGLPYPEMHFTRVITPAIKLHPEVKLHQSPAFLKNIVKVKNVKLSLGLIG
jgi:hypothetical protein